MVKNLLAIHKTWVQSLGQEDPLEKEMATHSRILTWEISWTEEPTGLLSMGSQKLSDTTEQLNNNKKKRAGIEGQGEAGEAQKAEPEDERRAESLASPRDEA